MNSPEQHRLAALREQHLLDTPAEARFDRLTAMASAHFATPIALVSLVDDDRQWFKSCVGLPVDQTPRDWAFCDHAIRGEAGSVMVVCDATKDPRFADNPLVTGEPFIRFYAGAVLTSNSGYNLGTLCVIDTVARQPPSAADLVHLQTLAKLVVDQFELSQARKNLSEQKRLLNLAESMSQVGYWTLRTDTKAVFWSNEVYRIHGVDPETFDPSLGDALDFYVPKDRERIRALLADESATANGWSFEAEIIRRSDQSVRHVQSAAVCERDTGGRIMGYFGVFRDLTEERRLLLETAEREKRYRLLATSARDIVAVYGVDGRFSYLSPSILEVLGYAPEELVGKTPFDIMLPEEQKRVADLFAAAAKTREPLTVEYKARTKSGDVVWLEARPRFQRDEDGTVFEISDTVRDVSERRKREADLAASQAAAEEVSRAKAEFLARMSHEIRTPLNGILGFSDVLGQTALAADQSRYLDRIKVAGKGLSALIDDILDFSKIGADKMTLDEAPADLRELLTEVVELAEAAAAGRLEFDVEFPGSDSLWMVLDAQRVRQVLLNLLGNAAKFTAEGSVRTRISILGDRVEVRITDTGIGIDAEVLPKLFDGFTQADVSTSRRFGGTGLGLSISRSLARLMNGDVRLESQIGRGATAIFELPYRPVAAAVASPAPAPAAGPDRSLRVLIVDDVEANLDLIQIILERAGHKAAGVNSGEDALEVLRRDSEFDAILMDVQMPGIDGHETTRQIRRLEGKVAGIPIIALSANVMAEQISQCRAAGMDDHVGKPVVVERLFEALDRATSRTERAGGTKVDAGKDDLLADLKVRYRRHMTTFEAEFDRISESPPSERPHLIAAFSHTVAGTSGSLGFPELSRAAFRLEAAAMEVSSGARQAESLGDLICALIRTAEECQPVGRQLLAERSQT